MTSYLLAQCASQPLYGKLSDVFGRKVNLVAAYIFFAVGCLLCGVSQKYWQVLAGRAISGVGGAGMTALVSVVISDMVPVRSVAAWRSYVNVAATTGRAIGGPVGGWLCDTIGWRRCFLGQIPIALLGMVLILWKMPTNISRGQKQDESFSAKCRRIDILGASTLVAAIIVFLLLLDSIADDSTSTTIVVYSALLIVFTTAFYHIETYHAREPILPIRLLTARPALTSYMLSGLQVAAQFGFYYATPIYFQIVAHSSIGLAGLHLVPAVVGNAVAGLLAGYLISRTGRYKLFTLASCTFGCIGYILITIRWRGETIIWPEALYIFCGGFAAGAVGSTTFIHLAASLDPADIAVAGTTLYLAQNLFLLVGVQIATTVLHIQVRRFLNARLSGLPDKAKIVETAVSSVQEIRLLPGHVRRIVEDGYIDALTWTFGECSLWNVCYFALLLRRI